MSIEKSYDTTIEKETAILVGAITQKQPEAAVKDYLDELEFLAQTANAVVLKRFTQKMDRPNSKTFVGEGKLQEIADYVEYNQIDCVIFDDELSPAQIRNLQNKFNPDEFAEHQIKVMDRSNLILDIFAARAQTAHARVQVELAQLQYLLPRLTRLWTHLSKQKGGIGMKGPGETEIETDRRIIRDKIHRLKKDLEKVDVQKATQRGNRGQLIRVALVGYTNVGKSTLMNSIAKSKVFAENKLFATLDTTVRKVVFGNLPFLMSDTVGFIRKLPHQLVESFKSTLVETTEADLLIHVIDVSHKNFEDHYKTVNETLSEIHGSHKPIIVVANKIDAVDWLETDGDVQSSDLKQNLIETLKKSWVSNLAEEDVIFISALNKLNLEELKEKLYETVKKLHQERYPYNNFYY
ncbi:MAG: GTPase HflX [Flavobacteriales bacterium]